LVVELPDPVAPPEAPLLGEVLGEVVLLPEPVAPELEPDLLKYASHSEREIWPSLLVSTDEKVGAAVLKLVLPDDTQAPCRSKDRAKRRVHAPALTKKLQSPAWTMHSCAGPCSSHAAPSRKAKCRSAPSWC
jgi:hypothetical protein